jgi:hypothetical protein
VRNTGYEMQQLGIILYFQKRYMKNINNIIDGWKPSTKRRLLKFYFASTFVVIATYGLYLLQDVLSPAFVKGAPHVVTDEEAFRNVGKYEDRHFPFFNHTSKVLPFLKNHKHEGVFYDKDSLIRYLKDQFPVLVKRHMDNMPADSPYRDTSCRYKWRVGFADMETIDSIDNRTKHDFYFIPILVELHPKPYKATVFDYFDSAKNKMIYYYPKASRSSTTLWKADDPPGNAFNTGQIWP